MRYKFHDQLAAIKRNPQHVLPVDINAPVIAFLNKIGCEAGARALADLQTHIDYGTLDLERVDVPGAKISIQVDAGMAEGYRQYETKRSGDWVITKYKTIRNANLDKRRPKPSTEEQR